MWHLFTATALALAASIGFSPSCFDSSLPETHGAQGQETPARADAPAARAGTDGFAGRAVGPLAGSGGLLAGELGIVTFAQLDEVLIWRDGRSSDGEAALRQLLELRTLKLLAEQQNIVITDEALLERFEELDAQARQDGVTGGLAQYIKDTGVEPAEFREYLRLAMIHETLTRAAFNIDADKDVTGDQQQLWLEQTLTSRGYVAKPHPWAGGVVCTSGDLTITREEFAVHLRKQIDREDKDEAIYLILLERAVRARMPEVSDEGVAAALDREIQRRTEEAESNPLYQGASYEQLLDARGLSTASLRHDPAIRASALAYEVVDRANDDAALRAFYAKESVYFDGRFGESVQVRMVFKNATERADDPLRPSFVEIEEEMRDLAAAIGSPEEFLRVVEIHSQNRDTRENDGILGRMTRHTAGAPQTLRDAVFEAVDAAKATEGGTIDGVIIGPIRVPTGVMIAMLSDRRPAPRWDVMKEHVHHDLRRRFLEETLMRASVLTYLHNQ